MIKISHLSKKYELSQPLIDVNTTINSGDIISIIGPSGCGKSTLLRCINMLEHPTSGSIVIDGIDITNKDNYNNSIKLKMGMVFQSFNLFPHMTIIENVMYPQVDILKRSNQEAYDKAMEVLHMVGMDGKTTQYPSSLSGGQKQRVAIARTLVMEPDVILFDEPTSALDPTMVGEVQSVLRELSKLGKTMLIVTHEMRFAKEICNRVFYIDQGRIYEEGSPKQIFENPKKDRTRRFIKQLKVFEAVIDSKEFDYASSITEMIRYGIRNQIDTKTINKMQSCFEELCLQILLPTIDNPLISFSLEYNALDDSTAGCVLYNGKHFNPKHTDNELSLSILKNIVKNTKYYEINESGYTNKYTFEIRTKK